MCYHLKEKGHSRKGGLITDLSPFIIYIVARSDSLIYYFSNIMFEYKYTKVDQKCRGLSRFCHLKQVYIYILYIQISVKKFQFKLKQFLMFFLYIYQNLNASKGRGKYKRPSVQIVLYSKLSFYEKSKHFIIFYCEVVCMVYVIFKRHLKLCLNQHLTF